MLRFLSKIKVEFNAVDPRSASCMEFLALCNSRRARESNPSCAVGVRRRTDEFSPRIAVTFVDGSEETFDAAAMAAEDIQNTILEKAQVFEAEQMFREAGEKWPVLIPDDELRQPYASGNQGQRVP
ncbi:uncharacterized protein LOC127246863 [Andrographis paniculata]|uniref:uncharacterized protein LOC127246863 n=1 Tax=Andrographis paniculata TaxID=175694 RepID=UPI0021E92F8C|nr:uncharacterized protein LOC127246863 [Andrographis paniculata]